MEKAIKFSAEVADALKAGKPVVALESTIISHGLPRPSNLEVALECERIVREAGAVPATIALLDGKVLVGLERPELVCGINIFATGGLGGVHRGANESFDESADLTALSQLDMTIICAGVKSILDVHATLERLETLAIGLVGYKTNAFPGFYLTDSGYTLEHRVDSPEEIAAIIVARTAISTQFKALVVANPVQKEMAKSRHDEILASGLARAKSEGIDGKLVTPFLLEHFHTASKGESLAINTEIIKSNCLLAAQIAVAFR